MVTGHDKERGLRRCWLGAWLAAAILVATESRLAAQGASEYEVKAAFLYNFAKFVNWPPQALAQSDTLYICVLGADPFHGRLHSVVSDKTVQHRHLTVRRLEHQEEARACHILFVSQSDLARVALGTTEGAPVLTVGDDESFAQRGGMIAFRMQGNKVRFTINTEAASRAGLQISSQLLKLAVNVIEEQPTSR